MKFQPGVPVKPMLAKPMTGISEVLGTTGTHHQHCRHHASLWPCFTLLALDHTACNLRNTRVILRHGTQVLDKFQDKPFTCEYKYDGERAQVHILAGDLTFGPGSAACTVPQPQIGPCLLQCAGLLVKKGTF